MRISPLLFVLRYFKTLHSKSKSFLSLSFTFLPIFASSVHFCGLVFTFPTSWLVVSCVLFSFFFVFPLSLFESFLSARLVFVFSFLNFSVFLFCLFFFVYPSWCQFCFVFFRVSFFVGSSMEEPSVTRDFAWTESSGSDASAEPFTNDSDRSSQFSDDLDAPFARHGLLLEADPDSVHMQRLFWRQCAMGFI